MANLRDIKDFIKDKYEASVSIFNDGCILKTPKTTASPKYSTYYTIDKYRKKEGQNEDVGLCIEKFNENHDLLSSSIYTFPEYSLRTLLISHIVKSCVSVGYPFSLVNFIHENKEVGQEGVFQFLLHNINLDEENLKKEELMREIFLEGEYNTQERLTMVTDEIQPGFLMLCNFFLEII